MVALFLLEGYTVWNLEPIWTSERYSYYLVLHST